VCGGCPKACGAGPLTSEIVTINPKTAAIQVSPVLASPLFGGVALDPTTQTLWALTPPPPGIIGANPSIAILSVDPTTGAETTVATHTGEVDTQHPWVALDPASHALYVATVNDITGAGQLLALDTSTGTLSAAVNLAAPVSGLVFDTSSAFLFGVTTSTPEQLAKIDPTTGTETAVATFGPNIIVNDPAIDSASHTVFGVDYNSLTVSADQIVTVNDQTGAISVGASTPTPLDSLAFAPVYTRGVTRSTSISPPPRGPISQTAPHSPGPRVPATAPAQKATSAIGLTTESSGIIWPVDEWFDFPALMIH
jgi:outer membrane protein assembly factor BamB